MLPRPRSTRVLISLLVLGVVHLSASPAGTQDDPARPSAAALFEETLAAEGLDVALARVSEALADTTVPYAIEPQELLRELPRRLVLQHKLTEALELVKIQEPFFGDSPIYWFERGNAHLRCAQAGESRAAFTKALEMAPTREDIAWMLDHLDQLVANARLQAGREASFTPGQTTGLNGPYLGQTPPGQTPEPFAPGIVSTTAHEYHISCGPDGREIFFSRSGVGTLVTRWRDDGWTAPEIVHLLGEGSLSEEANFTPDGQAVVFCGRASAREKRDLYRARRIDGGWSEAELLFRGMYATATLDGTLYYTAEGARPDYGVIVKRRWTGAGFSEPEIVAGEGINSEFPDAHPWVAPDESLLLFDSYRQPGAGIYVSFRQADGSWGRAILLNERLGIPPVGQCAMSHDGRFLFYCLAGDMWWVDASFLDELRGQ